MSDNNDHPAARLARAKAYPYPTPDGSYLFADGETRPLTPDLDVEERTPVLGYGSNRAPEQLARKFPEADEVIPVMHGWLDGFDVVYAAHLAHYGSLPAALIPEPDTRVAVSVLWLDNRQLERMHETEALGRSYAYTRLDRVTLALEGGMELDSVYSYESKAGVMLDSGRPMALAAIAAQGRQLPALEQEDALAWLRDRLEPAADLDAFILGHVDDPTLRQSRQSRMRESARVFAYDHAVVIKG
jgi:hypothetical protein